MQNEKTLIFNLELNQDRPFNGDEITTITDLLDLGDEIFFGYNFDTERTIIYCYEKGKK